MPTDLYKACVAYSGNDCQSFHRALYLQTLEARRAQQILPKLEQDDDVHSLFGCCLFLDYVNQIPLLITKPHMRDIDQ